MIFLMNTAATITAKVNESATNANMARNALRTIGQTEGSMLVFTARNMNADEIGQALAKRDWTWADVVKMNF